MSTQETTVAAAAILEALAECAERMNAFAQRLREGGRFRSASTGSDIRRYADGWRVEKYVEAALRNERGQYAVWWLELSLDNGNWRVDSATYITNGEHRREYPPRVVPEVRECARQLHSAVSDLEASDNAGEDFRKVTDVLSLDN